VWLWIGIGDGVAMALLCWEDIVAIFCQHAQNALKMIAG
jgi:hypothetical protein